MATNLVQIDSDQEIKQRLEAERSPAAQDRWFGPAHTFSSSGRAGV